MCESSSSKIDLFNSLSESIEQKNEGSMDGGQQAADGSGNVQIQQYNDYHFYCPLPENKSESDILLNNQLLPSQQNSVGECQFKHHKFSGKLVTISLRLYKVLNFEKLLVILTISFGKTSVYIPNPIIFKNDKKTYIKFGIKNGDLYLDFDNGTMPLEQRKFIEYQDFVGVPTGDKPCIWQFELKDEFHSKTASNVLFGFIQNQEIGTLDLLPNFGCELTADFRISVDRDHIEIVGLDDEISKKHKQSKISLLLKYLESQLEDYVSKVSIKYERTTIS